MRSRKRLENCQKGSASREKGSSAKEKCESVDMNQEKYLWNGRSESRSLPRLIKVCHAVGRQQQYEPVMGLGGTCTHVLRIFGVDRLRGHCS